MRIEVIFTRVTFENTSVLMNISVSFILDVLIYQ